VLHPLPRCFLIARVPAVLRLLTLFLSCPVQLRSSRHCVLATLYNRVCSQAEPFPSQSAAATYTQGKRSTVYFAKYGKEYLQAMPLRARIQLDAKGRPAKYKVRGACDFLSSFS
jgi:hypothetical protein